MIEAYSVGDIISTNDFVPFSEVKKVLKRTEPVTQVPIYLDGKDNIKIVLDDDWGYGGKQRYVEAPTNNTISINDKTWTLNRSCTVALYMKIGLSERFAYRTPGSVGLERHEYDTGTFLRRHGIVLVFSVYLRSHFACVCIFSWSFLQAGRADRGRLRRDSAFPADSAGSAV